MTLLRLLPRMASILLLLLVSGHPAFAQHQHINPDLDAALKKFPGFTASQMSQLLKAKKEHSIPLPTWLPPGFKVERLVVAVDPALRVDRQELTIVYSRSLKGGQRQRFTLEAGLDGIGDLMYDSSQTVSTPLGEVYLFYNPSQDGAPVRHYVRTDWFDLNGTAWAYASSEGMNSAQSKGTVMISIADTKRILEGLERL